MHYFFPLAVSSRYVAGYIAFKLREKYPQLGSKTCDVPLDITTSAPWILHISSGGLMLPTEEFLTVFHQLEEKFNMFHGAKVDKKPDVIKRLHIILERAFKDTPSAILLMYARVRTFIRIKALNCKLKLVEADSTIRKLKQIGQHMC
jgi:hypothetical protein